ncbi:hypothetical protein [Burkholderia territorii]|uniref:hypothetical protein n=1 Tax=Burkholderia territorii TaxID=1503055 RepID=UPI0012D8BB45|nr:hypothetical protein [Burkholderia territorii]
MRKHFSTAVAEEIELMSTTKYCAENAYRKRVYLDEILVLYSILKALVHHDIAECAREGLDPCFELDDACDALAKIDAHMRPASMIALFVISPATLYCADYRDPRIIHASSPHNPILRQQLA